MPGFQSGIALKKAALPPYAGSGCSICPLPPLAARGFFIASHNPPRLTFAPVSSTSPGDFIHIAPRSYPRRPPHFRSGFIHVARGFHLRRPGRPATHFPLRSPDSAYRRRQFHPVGCCARNSACISRAFSCRIHAVDVAHILSLIHI